MASEAQLRRRIHELQTQIESLQHQNENFQNDMSRRMNERFKALKAEYDRALVRQKNETDELYAARIRTFQEKTVKEMRQQYRLLERESARISKMQTEKIAELSECNEELRLVLQRMKAHSEEADRGHRMYADSLMEQL